MDENQVSRMIQLSSNPDERKPIKRGQRVPLPPTPLSSPNASPTEQPQPHERPEQSQSPKEAPSAQQDSEGKK